MHRLGSMPARVKLKGIDGGPHKRWSMWFNSMIREEPYLGLTSRAILSRYGSVAIRLFTGAAWLSSIPLSFTLAGILPRLYTYCVCLGTEALAPTPSVHRLLCGLPGYLILFAPRTFVYQRQSSARNPPSPPVFFQISTDSTPTLGIPVSPP